MWSCVFLFQIILAALIFSTYHDDDILQNFFNKTDIVCVFQEINHVASSSEFLCPVDDIQVHIVHCQPHPSLTHHVQGAEELLTQINTTAWKEEVALPPNVEVKVFSVYSGIPLSKKMMSLALSHYDLASTTVTGIPMKEEQNANR